MPKFLMFFDPSSRTHWLAMVIAFVMTLLYFRGPILKRCQRILSPRLFWHPSARLDYKIIVTNTVLKTLLLAPVLYGITVVATSVSLLLKISFGPTQVDTKPWLFLAIFSLTSFVIEDFSRWLIHYWQHRYQWLWRFHQVHHSARVLTPFTLNRTHPVEMLMGRVRHILVFGLISGVFFYLSGESLKMLTIFGVDAFGFLFNALGANLRHSHVAMSFGPLERLIISPLQHQMHHWREGRRFVNLGSCFSVWDQLAGFFYPAQKRSGSMAPRFGLPRRIKNHEEKYFSALFGPFARAKTQGVRRQDVNMVSQRLEYPSDSGDRSEPRHLGRNFTSKKKFTRRSHRPARTLTSPPS